MALIRCNECKKEISDKAKMCIHCGCPIEEIKKQEKTKNKKNFEKLTKEEKLYVFSEYSKNNNDFGFGIIIGLLAFIILLTFILPPVMFLIADMCLLVVIMQYTKNYVQKYYENNDIDFSKMSKKALKEKKENKNKLIWKIVLGISIFMCGFTTLGTIFSGEIIMTPIVLDFISIILIIISLPKIKNK